MFKLTASKFAARSNLRADSGRARQFDFECVVVFAVIRYKSLLWMQLPAENPNPCSNKGVLRVYPCWLCFDAQSNTVNCRSSPWRTWPMTIARATEPVILA